MDRDSLVDAGLGLISRFGSRALSLTAVASQAGVARATAYRMFGGRNALVDAIVQREMVLLRQQFAQWGAEDSDPKARIHTRVLRSLVYMREHTALQYVLKYEPDQLARALISVGVNDRPSLIDKVVDAVQTELTDEDEAILRPSPRAGLEIIVRVVYSHMIVPQSALSDEQVADAVVRAVTES